MKTPFSFKKCWRGSAALFLVAALLGCGDDAPDTYHVSGTVTFDGKPIPAGTIRFVPDGAKQNSGPPGIARIADGKYDTSAEGGKGHVGGPMIVQIEGHDPSGQGATDEETGEKIMTPLFPGYKTTAELPKDASTKDFAVPAEAANVKAPKESIHDLGGGV